jgi:uracil phosphoribosyltransferase
VHPNTTVISHPLVAHKLSLLRDKTTSSMVFRSLMREVSQFLAYEALRDLPTELRRIETPLVAMDTPFIAGKKMVFVPILRAGMGLLDGMLDLVPSARVGHIGLYRDPHSLEAVGYYAKVPEDIAARHTVVLDPMLATGHSMVAAVNTLKQKGALGIRAVCLLAAPEGLDALHAAHPDVRVFLAAVDSHLDEHGYIVPGLGDAGDRLYGTK